MTQDTNSRIKEIRERAFYIRNRFTGPVMTELLKEDIPYLLEEIKVLQLALSNSCEEISKLTRGQRPLDYRQCFSESWIEQARQQLGEGK